jgi:hypothetical protein
MTTVLKQLVTRIDGILYIKNCRLIRRQINESVSFKGPFAFILLEPDVVTIVAGETYILRVMSCHNNSQEDQEMTHSFEESLLNQDGYPSDSDEGVCPFPANDWTYLELNIFTLICFCLQLIGFFFLRGFWWPDYTSYNVVLNDRCSNALASRCPRSNFGCASTPRSHVWV